MNAWYELTAVERATSAQTLPRLQNLQAVGRWRGTLDLTGLRIGMAQVVVWDEMTGQTLTGPG